MNYGPEIGETKISAYIDYYKPTMGQVLYEKMRDEQVTFEFKNRRPDRNLLEFVDPEELQTTLNSFKQGWQSDEISFLAGEKRKEDQSPLFGQGYLDYLEDNSLSDVQVSLSEAGALAVHAKGDAPLASPWETVVMGIIAETYFTHYVSSYCKEHNIEAETIFDEGDRRLSEKIAILKSRPDIKIADFGTRRRFSYRWHKHVLGRLATECPENLIGTSNVWLAKEFGLMPIGTFAHEMPMIYAAVADRDTGKPLDGVNQMYLDWREIYGENLSTLLPDTVTSDYFFGTCTKETAEQWQGLRHDSGDPIEFAEKAIALYERFGIDPLTKTIVFSDGLDIKKIVDLADYFAGKINVVFGWGTTLMNDLGIPIPELDIESTKNPEAPIKTIDIVPLNIVMKAVKVGDTYTIKLSDDAGKFTGPAELAERYRRDINEELGNKTLALAV